MEDTYHQPLSTAKEADLDADAEVVTVTAVSDAIADGQWKQLDPDVVRYDRIVWWITTPIVCGLLFLPIVFTWGFEWLPLWTIPVMLVGWLALTVLMVWAAWRMPRLEYEYTRYQVRPDGIEICKGVFWRSATAVPRSRVQHIDVSQGPLQRKYGLATLTVYTAGSEFNQVTLSGIAHDTALRLRDFLLRGDRNDGV